MLVSHLRFKIRGSPLRFMSEKLQREREREGEGLGKRQKKKKKKPREERHV